MGSVERLMVAHVLLAACAFASSSVLAQSVTATSTYDERGNLATGQMLEFERV
jgi:hypothetical protein